MEGIDTRMTPLPVCPHCGARLDDWWDGLGLNHDGDTTDIDCGSCGENYQIEFYVDVSFSTKKKEGCE